MQVPGRSQQSDKITQNIDARIDEALALAAVYGLVARCLEDEIDPDLLHLFRGELGTALAESGWQLDEQVLNGAEEEVLESLAEEYTGLFVAPGCRSPYASVFETGCMYKEPSDRVIAAYHEAGWDYRRRLSGEFPDHVGTMLGFVARLTQTEAEALKKGDHGEAARARQRRNGFLLQQIGPWVPGWCRRAARAAFRPFYRQLAQFTEQLLWTELATVTDRRGLKELAALNEREPKELDYDADFRKASGL